VKSETNDVQQVFQDRRQYRVPFYQRAYVWSKEEQWEPRGRFDSADMDTNHVGNAKKRLSIQLRMVLSRVSIFAYIDGYSGRVTRITCLRKVGYGFRDW
jgi:hypothetical protein